MNKDKSTKLVIKGMTRIMLVILCGLVIHNVEVRAADLVGDMERGKVVFKKCKSCHTVDNGGKHRVGPNLWNIYNDGIANREGFKYSKIFKERKGQYKWDAATLDIYLKSPRKWAPKGKMVFVGLKKDQDRADVIKYLESLQ